MLGKVHRETIEKLWKRKLDQDEKGLPQSSLAEAAHLTNGRLISLEIEPVRQTEAKEIAASLGLASWAEFVLGDAGDHIPRFSDFDLVLIDCEKADYIRFFDMLRLSPEAIVVADNIISHDLQNYVAHVRARRDAE